MSSISNKAKLLCTYRAFDTIEKRRIRWKMNDFATAVIAAIVTLSSHPRMTTKVKNTNVPVAMERVALNVRNK